MSKTLIVDISHHQPTSRINWAQAAKEVAFMVIRVQYGSYLIDREYRSHVANCKKHGIPFGHYAYALFKNVEDAKKEAKDFLKRMDPEAKFLVVDVEERTTATVKEMALAAQAFIDVLKDAGVEKVGLYTGHHFYKPYGMENVKADFLWIPRYGANDGTPNQKPDYPCCLWQYTDKGRVSWYSGNVDLNQINGDKTLEWFTGEGKQIVKDVTPKKVKGAQSIASVKVHVVKPGDTLSKIAVKYKTTVEALVKLNNIHNKDLIFTGQKIKYQGTANVSTKKASSTKKFHKVQKGDTVSELALKHGSSIQDIKAWNKLDSKYTIITGSTIRVK
ncbi:LysM peptidoglycan-binding domain-containing protein [Mesobacillus thioparans]|uniref:LysM peptidoglycan-binding domain-containing protein n=1 Tax=Mesobacillus thioparans TaxID=370439 RepID=UPI0039F083B1